MEIIYIGKIVETTDREYSNDSKAYVNWLGQNEAEITKELWSQDVKSSNIFSYPLRQG